ncbi:hypothetical protein SAMN05414139_05378 [Burkholderia sp. D7]|nr:hypothetical protein SAMN05414139_05378 [Burkholderia sp. D7]
MSANMDCRGQSTGVWLESTVSIPYMTARKEMSRAQSHANVEPSLVDFESQVARQAFIKRPSLRPTFGSNALNAPHNASSDAARRSLIDTASQILP